MKYTQEQVDKLNPILNNKFSQVYNAMDEDGDFICDSYFNLGDLKKIVEIIEEFDKENGIS